MSLWLSDQSWSLEETWIISCMVRRDNVIQRNKPLFASYSHPKWHNTSATLLKQLNMFWDNNFVYTQEKTSETINVALLSKRRQMSGWFLRCDHQVET